jgi:quercetin dioxygenase-like cupin family protein
LSVAGGNYLVLADAASTGGAYAAFEGVLPAGSGPPCHLHRREDEAFYVLEGQFAFTVDGNAMTAGPGDFIHAPRGVPHSFRNVGPGVGRLLVTNVPAGIEVFFEAVGQRAGDKMMLPGPPTPDEIGRLVSTAARFGIEILT